MPRGKESERVSPFSRPRVRVRVRLFPEGSCGIFRGHEIPVFDEMRRRTQRCIGISWAIASLGTPYPALACIVLLCHEGTSLAVEHTECWADLLSQ
jgi:hypothetical protein